MKYLPLILLIFIVGCISAKAKISGTDVITPYGTANSVNGEVDVNTHR